MRNNESGRSMVEMLGVSADEVAANCDDFKRISATDSYWVSGRNVVHFNRNCEKEIMTRGDGYWGAGAVLCK